MAWLGQRNALRAWRFFLALLLMAPLLARAHTHLGEAAKPVSCAICVATQHSPTLAAAPVCCPLPAFRTIPLGTPPSATAPATVIGSHLGRAPPAPLPTRFE